MVEMAARERTRVISKATTMPDVEHSTSINLLATQMMIRLDIRKTGKSIAKLMAAADPADPAMLRQLLMNAIRRTGDDEASAGSYEMLVSDATDVLIGTFVVA